MERNQLEEYRKHIESLTDDERIKRDLYLRDLAIGKIQGPSTGYPSLDKPWLKYHSTLGIINKTPCNSAYLYMKNNNLHNLNGYAINYYGNKITYNQMFKQIDLVAEAFLRSGIQPGDVVTICLPNIPEAVYIFYALNKLGAIANFVHVLSSGKEINYFNKTTNSKIIISLDKFIGKIVDNCDNNIKICSVSASESLPPILKIIFKLKTKSLNNKRVISWKKFINQKGNINLNNNIDSGNRIATILYTGGTTSSPKGVMLTNNNLNALADEYIHLNLDIKQNEKLLDIIPPFVPYGLCGSIHMPLCCCAEVIMIPEYNPKGLDKLILTYKPNHVIGVPAHWEHLLKSNIIEEVDLSFLKTAAAGGDKLSAETEREINMFLKKHNCKYNIIKGYGMTELSSSACSCTINANKVESVGVPLVKNNAMIINLNQKNEQTIGNCGEICISGPTLMEGYLNNEKLTTDTIFEKDGIQWIHTGDYGYIDGDGLLYIKSRIKRMIIKSNGYKIYPLDIENVLNTYKYVEASAVIGVPDLENGVGMVPVAVIQINPEGCDKVDLIIEELKMLCKIELSERCELKEIYVIDEIPLTSLGKVDYNEIDNFIKKQGNMRVRKK